MNEQDLRLSEFQKAPLAWLLVRHFLPAPLLEELTRAVVVFASDDEISLDALFESCVTRGPTVLAAWAAKPKLQEETLERHLQNLVQFLIWQGDQSFPNYQPDVKPRQKERLVQIQAALDLSHSDLGSGASDITKDSLPPQLSPFVDAMAMLRSSLDNDAPVEIDSLENLLSPQSPSPLPTLFLKHLGDLAADRDKWAEALAIYERARDRIDDVAESAWRSLVEAVEIPVSQSCAMALWVTKGPAAAASLLDTLLAQARTANGTTAFFNAAHDALNAHSAVGAWDHFDDARGGFIAAPQLITTHHNGQALGRVMEGRFSDAHRWFWATLRRQTALGVTTETRTTKSQFGRALIENIEQELGRRHHPADFLMATRLLVDGGNVRIAESVKWPEKLVARYVNEEAVEALVRFASRHAGAKTDRDRVLVTLFKAWLEAIPAAHSGPAKAMIGKFAELAASQSYNAVSTLDIGGAAMKALQQIGRSRPEFRAVAIEDVELAIRCALTGNGRAVEAAVETAGTYAAQLDVPIRREIVELVISLLDQSPETGKSIWILRPALNLLSSDPVFELLRGEDKAFARRAAGTLLRASLDAETERARVMYLLRDLDPALIEDQIDQSRLTETVAGLAESAKVISSSASPGSIQAMLVAPAISGPGNIELAIECLEQILTTTAQSARAPMAFADAYGPLLVLAQNYKSIADAAGINPGQLVERLTLLERPLIEMWEKAARKPEIFAGFSIPPSNEPNRVIVHNWTFASLAFAKVIGRIDPLARALDQAMGEAQLETAIAVARAIRVDGAEAFAEHDIESEPRDVFYAALGRRLLRLKALPEGDRREQVARLFQRCLEVGPSGLDLGIMIAADALGMRFERSSRSDNYVERLGRDPGLRHGLMPILDSTFES